MNIRNIFKRREKNKLLVSWEPGIGMREENAIDISEVIEKCSKNMPPYWNKLGENFDEEKSINFHGMNILNTHLGRSKKEFYDNYGKLHGDGLWNKGNNISRINASTCPSFIEILKNSYIIKTPVELYIKTDGVGLDVISSNPSVCGASSHPLNRQLWGNFNKNLLNIKFEIMANVKTLNKRTNMVMFDSIYYTDLPFKVMPGILPVNPKYPIDLNINTTIDKRLFKHQKYTKLIKAGTPLAMFYVPDGILNLESSRLGLRYKRYFIADFFKKLNEK